MNATYRISEDDYVNAMRLFTKFTPRAKVIFVFLSSVLILLAIFGSPEIQSIAIGGLAGALIVHVVGRYIVSPILARKHYRKYKAIQDEFTVEVLLDGVRFASPNADGKLTWEHMLKWRQNDDYILIYPMPRIYHIIPKSIASSGFDVPLLINWLTQHVGEPT